MSASRQRATRSDRNRRIRRSALAAALGLCLASTVHAQSNAAGSVFGNAEPGATVIIERPETGFSRRIGTGSDGSFRASALPIGTYRVTVQRADGSTEVRENVRVNVGTGTDVNFAAANAGGATTLAAVQVIGGAINPIDVSSVESSTILTSEQIDRLPVPRDISSVALLAPGTVKGDAAFGNLASFGGSSVAENQYYLNGLNITNSFKNLQFGEVPYEAISEQQIKTGGYGAEFGRSTGGVINLISKRGTNEFRAGGNVYWSPEALVEDPHDTYYRDGTKIADNSRDKGWEYTTSVWASGALVQDRLFAYALLQYGESSEDFYPSTVSGLSADHEEQESPKWLLKMDWNISDDHLMELTAFSDKRDIETDSYSSVFTGDDGTYPERGEYLGTNYEEEGGTSYALKYTGYLTDAFTLSALYGHSEFSRSNYAINALGIRQEYSGNLTGEVPGCPYIIDARQGVASGEIPPISGCDFVTTLGRLDAEDQRDQFRVDAEWILGDHVVRGGVDIDNFTTVDGSSYTGGNQWRYYGDPEDRLVRNRDFRNGAEVDVDSTAYYIEDTWSITDNFNAYVGLRWDTFENKNGNGETYVEIKNQFAPRLGLSWDVFGDSTFKVFANAGRYALPLTANVAIRGASASLYAERYYTYTDIDPVTGAPLGLTQVLNPNNGELVRYLNNEFGVDKIAETIAQEDLDPMYQDEYIVGMQKQFGRSLSLGVRATYRDLQQAIDDQCDYRPIFEWAEENGYEINDVNPGFPYCRLYNPGRDAVFNMDVDGDGTLERIPVAADVLGPDVSRTYKAVELFWQGSWERFFLQGSYTWSKSWGNTEGGVKSDIGQDATGTTQDFDYPELAIGSEGYLPNDRRHSLKLFGSYDLTEEWRVGANLLVQSGRPINCFGFLNGYETSRYANSYFSCDPGEPDENADNGGTIVPRGSAGRTPWSRTVDLNVAYRPDWFEGLQFKLDVFNVFNGDAGLSVYEYGEDANGFPNTAQYQYFTSYQAPRSVRFMVQYDWN
jgi:hypothetical protein